MRIVETHSLSKYTPFDNVHKHRQSTRALESSSVQCLLYFSPEIMTDKNIFVHF